MGNCNFELSGIKSQNHSLVPIHCGEEKCKPEQYWGAGVRSCYLIHFVVSGKGVFYCGPHKHTVEKGQIFVIFPDTIVKYQADANDPWHYMWLGFSGDEAKTIISSAGITLSKPVLTVKNPDMAMELLSSMPSERSADVKNNLFFTAKLYEFMSLILDSNSHPEKKENAYLTTATRYIKAYYSEDITVDKIAAHVGVSRKYLFIIFKNSLGISPKDYIVDYRIKKAKEFLMNEELSVGSIAYSVGYSDPLNFSKIFKKKTGVSPKEYRMQFIKE